MSEPTLARHLIPPDLLATPDLLVALTGRSEVRDLVADLNLRELADHSQEELRERGVTPAAARRLTCALELGRRVGQTRLAVGKHLRTSEQIFRAYEGRLRDLPVEQFWGIYLNGKSFVIRELLISQGIPTGGFRRKRSEWRTGQRL